MLDDSLSYLYSLNQEYVFDLIICNNASTDDTLNVIGKWKDQFNNFRVINHSTNLLYDRNFASGYRCVETQYCWLLGDSYYIDIENYRKVIYILNTQKPQALIINDSDKSLKQDNHIYTNCNDLLHDVGWYTTLLSSCIIKKEFLSEERFNRYYDTFFLHEGVFFDYLSTCDVINVYMVSSIHMNEIKSENKYTSGWRKTPFLVFGKCWYSFIMSLPYKYKVENKLFCIKEHNKRRFILNPRTILKNKMLGVFQYEDYPDARSYLKYVVDEPIIIYDLIYHFPPVPRLCSVLLKIKRFISKPFL